MRETDPMAVNPSATPPADDVIDLEPTIAIDLDAPSLAAEAEASATQTQIHMELVTEDAPSFRAENRELLQSRLCSAAWFVAVLSLVLGVFYLLLADDPMPAMGVPMLLRIVLAVGVGALLSRRTFSTDSLRSIEWLFFGGLTALVVASQYFGNLEFVRQRDLARLVGFERSGVIQMLLIMVLYGALIPNEPRRTARFVLTMVLVPLFVLTILVEREEAAAKLGDESELVGMAVLNGLFLISGAVLTIFNAYMLHGLRKELHAAKLLGQYKLGEPLGHGGMGEVYLAEHQLLKRPCALKLIRADHRTDAVALARFEREVRSAAMLTHPNTIEIFDYGHSDDGTFYYVMELLHGLGSDDVVKQFGVMPPGRAVYLGRQVCGALAEAHRMGLIHRDLKPANIFVAVMGGACDVAKVLDFGLVKQTHSRVSQAELTSETSVSGTPAYMSPEQATADPNLDHRSDLYALGCVLYYWLTGRPPFVGEQATALMIAHARDPIVPPSKFRPDLPADLEAVIVKCLAKEPAARFQDARDLGTALAACACAADWDERTAERWWADQAALAVASDPNGTAPTVADPTAALAPSAG